MLRVRSGFNADPDTDPAFFVNADPDTDLDPEFWWPKYSWKKILIFFYIKNSNLGRPSYRRSLHPSKENIQHFKTWIFFTFVVQFGPPGSGSVFPMRIRIQPTKMNADPCGSGSGSATPINSQLCPTMQTGYRLPMKQYNRRKSPFLLGLSLLKSITVHILKHSSL